MSYDKAMKLAMYYPPTMTEWELGLFDIESPCYHPNSIVNGACMCKPEQVYGC